MCILQLLKAKKGEFSLILSLDNIINSPCSVKSSLGNESPAVEILADEHKRFNNTTAVC